jgi:hypothetical protein
MALPPCGLYRTTAPIAEVPAGQLVYFHNHGDPGPGVYLPASWQNNRASFHRGGTTLPDEALASTLKALPREGLYVVESSFTCCGKNCRTFEPDTLVQLGYNGHGKAILFLPTLSQDGVALPGRGTAIDDDRLAKLRALKVGESAPEVH